VVPAQAPRYSLFVEFGGLPVGFKIVRHFEPITPDTIHGVADFLALFDFIDDPRPFFGGWPMPDMLPVAAVQKSYPVAVLVHFKSGYQAAHAAKSLLHQY